jgi:hypothetical protein
VIAALGLLADAVADAQVARDRRERFHALAAARLGVVEVLEPDQALAVHAQLFALLDEEVVESLASGGVFASGPFLQERLDGFAELWGGASLRVHRLGALTVGAFHLGEGFGGSSVRVYGGVGGEAQLLAVFTRPGRATVHAMPAAGPSTFLVAWEEPPTGRGTRALRVDLVHSEGSRVRVVWSTADEFAEPLMVRTWRIRGEELQVRYEVHYPGWVPGCQAQTEQEDVWRLAADGRRLVRVSRRHHQGWHRALHRTVGELLDALATGRSAVLSQLIPDERLRHRVPRRLARTPACDAPDGPEPRTVSVPASAGDEPWTLTFQREAGQWHLVGAAPVLQ